MKILVTGAAGYIGSHMMRFLRSTEHEVVALDNLSRGYRKAAGNTIFAQGDICDNALLDVLFSEHNFDAVLHFAAFARVGESVSDPAMYYDNNVCKTITLLDAVVRHKIKYFIFSSSAAIFGNPDYLPVDEDHAKVPINPYGVTKLMVENILADYSSAYGIKFGALRYFNAAGASHDGSLGQSYEPITHLIPLVLQTASGRRKHLSVFGNDYSTKDGSCVRDYVHVEDLVSAHLNLLDYMENGGTESFFNLGTGNGYSVFEVIKTAEKISGKSIKTKIEKRREGDPAILIADGKKAMNTLGWNPKYSDLETIIKHTWEWEKKLLAGNPLA